MRPLLILFTVLMFHQLYTSNAYAQDLPLVYDVENRCADCQKPNFPSVNELPVINSFPNPFAWADGRGVISNFSDWKYRRAEIGALIEHYEIGEKPVKPDTIEASYSDGTLTVHITVNGNTLTLSSPVTLPDGDGPFPAVIGMGGPSGSLPSDIFTSRDIAQIGFNFGQVMAHTQSRGNEPINELYPELTNMGSYSAWPWGVSRLIDGLELVSEDLNIDLERLAVTGCSFAGKMALFAGAFDERIALTISQESGGGGYTSWRFSDTMQGVETLSATNSAWFRSGFIQNFGNAVTKLPFDHHELMAMVAPRALFVTGNHGWTWLADESGYVASNAAQKVWDALGVPERFGYYNVGGHNHCALTTEKREHVEAFVDKFLLGNDSTDTDVAASPYTTDLSPWITWETPELSDGTSFLETAPLEFPSDEMAELDTSITFKWNQLEGAKEYRFQLATSASFSNNMVSEITTDTVFKVNDLQKGRTFHWRVQIKNNDDILGPWSSPYSFSTAIPLPRSPELVSVITHTTRSDYLTFKWRKSQYASKYYVEVAEDADFGTGLKTGNTSDTVRVFYNTKEGTSYFWRVKAENISGESPWSDVSNYTLILAPTNLELNHTRSNEITLTWVDNSKVEDGYVLERRAGPESSYSVIDTLSENTETYADQNLGGELTSYTYRIKAFMDSASSYYSNEAALTAVSVDEESGIPAQFSLSQNFPNPFNPSTNIQFEIPHASQVQLNVFNMLGQQVESLIAGRLGSGMHTIVFDASTLSSGVYFYTLRAGDFIQTRKLSLIK